MKKILSIALALLVLLSARTALASSTEVFVNMTNPYGYFTAVDLTTACPTTPIRGERVFFGVYPDRTTQIRSGASDSVCSGFLGGSNNEFDATAHGNGNYWHEYTFNGSTGAPSYATDTYYFKFTVAGTSVTPQGPNLTTHFTNIDISTSTQDFRLRGYISPADFASSTIKIGFNVSTPIYSQWDNEQFTATSSGLFDLSVHYQNFSTSTIDIFTFEGTLYTPSTDPFSGTVPPKIYDTISTSTTAQGIGVTHLPTPSETLTAIAENCSPFSGFFNITACISYLLFPDTQAVADNSATLRDNFLVKAPIGYFTRLYSILTSTGTTTIPTISYTWANDGGPLQGKTLAFDVDNYMVQAKGLTEEMVSNTDHKTAWQIFEPFINMFLAIVVLYNIIQDIMGLKLIHNKR